MPVFIRGNEKESSHSKGRKARSQGSAFDEDARDRLNQTIQATKIEISPITSLKPNPRNAKKHSDRQISLLAENYDTFGFTQPILIDEDSMIICGHARYYAALRRSLSHLPALRLSHLSSAEKRALALADNKLAELGEWDINILSEELEFIFNSETDLSFDPRLIGFETVEVDELLQDDSDAGRADPADQVDPPDVLFATTAGGDLWTCDEHRLVCGSALLEDDYRLLMRGESADTVFTDSPYNVPNTGHVTGRAGVREFEMANGEMTSDQFTGFLRTSVDSIANCVKAGAVLYFCMDWRHLLELRSAADPVFGALKNMIVWVKSNAGMGSFYRSQHELVLVYAAPGGKPINNFGLGATGRHRTNVWRYPGCNSFGRGRDEALAMHPTVKPVAMVADALMDCSHRGGIVLDPFGGSGTTMIAAERTGRRARLIELDPLYCDLIVQRWQTFSKKTARL